MAGAKECEENTKFSSQHGSGLFLLRLFYRALSGVVVEEFLGGVLWQLKNLRKVDWLCEQLLWVLFRLRILWKRNNSLWKDESCVDRTENQLITCYCITRLLRICGVWCLLLLGQSDDAQVSVGAAADVGWGGVRLGKEMHRRWEVIPHCLLLTIWKERNCKCFQE